MALTKLFRQLYLLQWKNAKLKQRQPVRTFFEVVAPLLTLLILIAVRQSQDFNLRSPDCQFKPTPLISKGPLAALQSFCFLGVCQNTDQKFQPDPLLNNSENRNLGRAIEYFNKVGTDATVRNLVGAIYALPSNWSDPKQTKFIRFGSLFSDYNSLFVGVNATEELRNSSANAPIRYPARWDIEVNDVVVKLIEPQLKSRKLASTIFCNISQAGSNESDWSSVSELCLQEKFKANVDSQFQLSLFTEQMKSTAPDKYTVLLNLKTASDLIALYDEYRKLNNEGVFKIFSSLLSRLSSIQFPGAGGDSGSTISTTIALLNEASKLLCGPGKTILTEYVDKLKERFNNGTGDEPTVAPATVAPSTNESVVDLNVITPPEEFCYNATYQKAITNGFDRLLRQLGFGNIFNVIFGVIPFYPDTAETRMYFSKVNETLSSFSSLADFSENWVKVEDTEIANFLVNSSTMATVRQALELCSEQTISAQLASTCQQLSTFLAPYPDIEPIDSNGTNWRDLAKQVDSLMYRVYYLTACFRLDKLQGFDNASAVDNYTNYLIDEFGAYKNESKPRLFSTVLFDKQDTGFVQYRMRFAQNQVDNTRRFKVLDRAWKPTPRAKFPNDFKYFTSFFIHLQELLEQGILSTLTNGTVAPTESYLTLFPSSCFIEDQFAKVIESFLPMIMTLSWIYNVALLVNAIVYEKETRLKEMMKIMGLSDGIHWFSWFVTSVIVMALASLLMTILLKAGQIIVYSDPLLLFIFLFSFVISTICEAFFISIFFSNSSVAAAFAGVLYFVGYLPYSVIDRFADSLTAPMYAGSCLIPQLAFGVGCKFLGKWELAGVGLQWDNFFDTPLTTSSFAFNNVITMMWIDAGLLMLITWYIEKVAPGKYGVPKPWYFLFTGSYWLGKGKAAAINGNGNSINHNSNHNSSNGDFGTVGTAGASAAATNGVADPNGVNVELNGKNHSHFEEEPTHLRIGVAVKSMSKIYYPGALSCRRNAKPFTAVDALNYNFYEGQVTSFLGHNGAGKSTTMSVLTGLYTPTFGTAYIAGHDIRTEMDAIRRQLGLCPQHNVLFDNLTVEDHIYFYGMLKGLTKQQVAPQIDSFIADVGLKHKRYEMSKNLSGGMKRKLSVAMAFVGDSKIVILDEPTAGVDPHARRSIWDVLAKFRKGRTIILTTHHMDEADILGDRICIINKGKLVCSGSPMFLKKVFGDGYTLTMVKSSNKCNADEVLDFVRKRVSEAELAECTSSELNIKLPFNCVDQFAQLFTDLENSQSALLIDSYGIEDCSLEEIFLKVTGCSVEDSEELLDEASVVGLRPAHRESLKRKQRQLLLAKSSPAAAAAASDATSISIDNNDNNAMINNDDNDDYGYGYDDYSLGNASASQQQQQQQPALSTARSQLANQIKALIIKRFHVLRRSKIGFIAEFILPAAFILLSLSLLQIVPRDGSNPPMELAPWYMLGNPAAARLKDLTVFGSREIDRFHGEDARRLQVSADALMQHVNATEFIGTRCMQQRVFHNERFPCRDELRNRNWSPEPTNLPNDTSNCRCSYDNYPNSVQCVDWPKPSYKLLASSDRIENMNGYNITNYIQSSVMQYYKRRFGGYRFFVNDQDGASSKERQFTNQQINQAFDNAIAVTQGNATKRVLKRLKYYLSLLEPKNATALINEIWYDNRGYVAGPAYLNVLHNALLRSAMPTVPADRIGISGWTHPITSQKTYVQNVIITNSVISATVVVSIIFALSFIPASFVLFLIAERTTGAKHLQFVSGVNPALYWFVNHAWNLINYLIPLAILVVLFIAFKNYEFIGKETIIPFLTVMLLFGFASAPLMYPFSWVMSVPSKAFTVLSCLNLGLGFTTTMSVTIVRMIGEQNNDEHMKQVSDILKASFLPLPHFCLGQSLMELNIYYQVSVSFKQLVANTGMNTASIKELFDGIDVYDNPWEPTSRYIICLILQSVGYFALVLLIEYNCCCKRGELSGRLLQMLYKSKYQRVKLDVQGEEMDDDVRAEAERAEIDDCDEEVLGDATQPQGQKRRLLRLRKLSKVYNTSSGPKAAVRGISLCTGPGECFGFLGVNGAGKTTTFKMLTGDVDPTAGEAFVDGYSILSDMVQVHQRLGYCPQFDALLPLLTGRETLELFARIRGVAESSIPELVTWVAKRVGMEAHIDKTTEEYSGGNKRKLSCGIALIGSPPIIFLDEPTAGMDPGARRSLWRCIQRMVAAGSCVILTTHSMEDCQALCHRLTIMVNGKLQCIGSPQHLKNKFGQGFTVFLRVKRPAATAAVGAAEAAVEDTNNTASSNECEIPDVKFSNIPASPTAAASGSNGAAAAAAAALAADGDEWVMRAHQQFVLAFPAAVLKESHVSTLQYQLQQTVPLAEIFAGVQRLKEEGYVADYSVNQTTLDQVFINFAKNQAESVEEVKQTNGLLKRLKNTRLLPGSNSNNNNNSRSNYRQFHNSSAANSDNDTVGIMSDADIGVDNGCYGNSAYTTANAASGSSNIVTGSESNA